VRPTAVESRFKVEDARGGGEATDGELFEVGTVFNDHLPEAGWKFFEWRK
jgi:hypothetical protein